MISLHLLGPVELRDSSGRALDSVLAQPKRLALLSYLACIAPTFVRRDTLLALLWPDLDETRARSALNQALGFLRRNLPADSRTAILSRGNEELAIDPETVYCDVTAFRVAIRDGNVAQAADLYRGDLLAGFFVRGAAGFEEWLEVERARVRNQAVNAMREATAAAEQANDLSRAITYAQRAVDLAPSDDRAVRTLLLLFDRVDDRGAAVEAYESFAARLRREVDASPAEETTALMQRIRSRAASPALRNPQPVSALVEAHGPADSPSASPVRPMHRHRPAMIFAALGLVIVAASIAWLPRTPKESARIDPLAYAVFPARVAGADSSFAFLSEGAMNVFNSVLARPGSSHALDARTVLQGYDATRQNTRGAFTSSDAAALGARLGAAYAVTAEVAATQSGTTVNARVIETSTGAIVAQHSETGAGDPLKLTSKTATRLIAKSMGESPARLTALSDSPDAMQVYYDAMRDTRAGNTKPAFEKFTRALEIDPTFAAAAFWRAHVAWGAAIFGNRPKLLADSVAWTLRDRMNASDRLFLTALPSIGPNYPKPTSGRQFVQAWENAAKANPDRPEVWVEWARFLNAWGHQSGIRSYRTIAARAADSAIALDSMSIRAHEIRAMNAVLMKDRSALRSVMDRWRRVDSTTSSLSVHFAAAKALGDSSAARALFARIAAAPANSPTRHNLQLWSAYYGLASVSEADRAFEIAHQNAPTPDERDVMFRLWAEVATLRGSFARANDLADSINRRGIHLNLIRLAIAEPAFRSIAISSVELLEARLDTLTDPGNRATQMCTVRLYRLSLGDTSRARPAIQEMRDLVRPLGPAPAWRVGALGVCPLLLEAGLDRRPSERWQSPALDRLERMLLDGILTESPTNLAYLIAARWRREQGKPAQALALIRQRDPMAGVVEQPASWRLEGDLALQTGDRAGAIRAYTRFLEIRDRPDAGPVAAEVADVRRTLAAIRK